MNKEKIEQIALIEFHVVNGTCEMVEPKELIFHSADDCKFNFGDPLRERGCTYEQFVEAYEYVKNKYSNT
jgi:hypothetical protein